MDRVGVGGGCGWNQVSRFVGEGAVGRSCRSSFSSRVGGTKSGPAGTGEAPAGAMVEPEGLGRPLGGAVSEEGKWGLAALRAGGFGGSRNATTRGRSRLFVRKTPRVSPQVCLLWAVSGERGERSDRAILAEESPLRARLGLRSVEVAGSREGLLGILCGQAYAWRGAGSAETPPRVGHRCRAPDLEAPSGHPPWSVCQKISSGKAPSDGVLLGGA